ncbi:hypothetical protein DPMN_073893 [Dreissena polymorpha]|uniref:Uncharacterized protein n=1 Tax=Dreissena polymorpha TaxID=45954 RepID=A0A9D3YDY0_DREPO|nr:hypothetical protein DPMN_073893 [Dreissena polymorpha]
MPGQKKKLFRANRSLDRTMSIDQPCLENIKFGQMSLDANADPQDKKIGDPNALVDDDLLESPNTPVKYRPYLVIVRATRRSWPSSKRCAPKAGVDFTAKDVAIFKEVKYYYFDFF